MELRELMKKLEISEDYIIEAAQKINMICKRCSCEECPLCTGIVGCAITTSLDIRIDEIVKKRIQKLIHPNRHPNRMNELAKLLGIKLYNWFTATNANGITRKYQLTEKGMYDDRGLAMHGLLTDLLTGRAYIVEEKDGNNE